MIKQEICYIHCGIVTPASVRRRCRVRRCCIQTLKKNIDKLKDTSKLKVINEDLLMTIVIPKSTHTIGNLIQSLMYNKDARLQEARTAGGGAEETAACGCRRLPEERRRRRRLPEGASAERTGRRGGGRSERAGSEAPRRGGGHVARAALHARNVFLRRHSAASEPLAHSGDEQRGGGGRTQRGRRSERDRPTFLEGGGRDGRCVASVQVRARRWQTCES